MKHRISLWFQSFVSHCILLQSIKNTVTMNGISESSTTCQQNIRQEREQSTKNLALASRKREKMRSKLRKLCQVCNRVNAWQFQKLDVVASASTEWSKGLFWNRKWTTCLMCSDDKRQNEGENNNAWISYPI